MTAPIVHHPDYAAPIPPGHRFPMGKFTRLAELLTAEGLAGPGGFHRPEPADRAALIRAHAPDYVDAVLAARVPPAMERRIGLPITPEVARRSIAATGGTLLTARLALESGLAANTAGGSHHAGPDGGAGFCVFNDVATAALALLAEGVIGAALVLDLDVHQGDGTARVFADDDRVTTVSVHCGQNFPTRKALSDLDVELPVGTGDEAYLAAAAAAFRQGLDLAVRRGRAPDMVFYVAGVDPHIGDGLGKLALSDAGLAAREAQVVAAALAAGLPLAGVLGGGYGPDPGEIAHRHAQLHRAMAAAAQARRGAG